MSNGYPVGRPALFDNSTSTTLEGIHMAIDFVRQLMQSGVLSGGDLAQLAKAGWDMVQGKRRLSPETDPSKGGDHTSVIKENKGQEGELYAIHGFLLSYGRRAVDYEIPSGQEHVFVEIVKQLKPGAIKRLMQTLAVEVKTVKHKKVIDEKTVPDPQDPKKMKKLPETEEWEDKINLKGPEVIRGLVWLVQNPGGERQGKPESERIAWVVEALETFGVFSNIEDKAKDFWSHLTNQTRETFGSIDTLLHIAFAVERTNRQTVQRILNSPEGKRLKAAIKSASEGADKKAAEEKLQRFLLECCKAITSRPSREQRKWRSGLPAWGQWTWVGGIAFIIVAGLIVAVIPFKQ